jgi:DNA-binding MarR family transcriptional regulator
MLPAVKDLDAVQAVQTWYPQIYLACHRDHKRARNTSSGISPRDSSILAHLHPQTPVTATALARHLGIGAPALSAALKRLVRLGYVVQGKDARDARVRPLRLSPQGARAMADSSVLEGSRVREVLRRLSAGERVRALEGLALLARASRELTAGQKR